MKKKTLTPPRLFLKFFRWYCHPQLLDYIEGDLFEVYERRLKSVGKRKADFHFMIDVLQLFRPGIIKPKTTKKHFNQSAMIKNYFTIGWRNLLRNKSYSTINIAGLALSLTCGIVIFTLVRHHLSFDNFHQHPDRIYRVVTELHRDVVAYNSNVPSPLGAFIRNDHTFTEKVARIFQQVEVLITTREGSNVAKFEEADGIAFAEPELFEIFNFQLLKGDIASALKEPNSAIITSTTARKYFGDKDPIGETIWLGNTIPFTITGVLNDFPANTDIRAAVVVSWSSLKAYEPWLADDQAGGVAFEVV